MSTTVADPSEDCDLQRQLDQLIPPPTGPGRKLAVGIALVALATCLSGLNLGGYLYPRPTIGSSFSSDMLLDADPGRGLAAAQVMLPNNSSRAVRITDVALDGPGAQLVTASVIVEEEPDTDTGSARGPATTIPLDGSHLAGAQPLPVTVDPDRTAWLVLWFRPIDCVDLPGPWGIAEVTVDFGAGAIPPFGRTIRIDQDPIRVDEEGAAILAGGEVVTADGPLAAACEALR